MHVGQRQSAEEIIGNVVVECYDFDDVSLPTTLRHETYVLHVSRAMNPI